MNYECNLIKYNDDPDDEGFKASVGFIFEFDIGAEAVRHLYNKVFPSFLPEVSMKPIKELESEIGLGGEYFCVFQFDSTVITILSDTDYKLENEGYSIKGKVNKGTFIGVGIRSLFDLNETDFDYHVIFTTAKKISGKNRDIYYGPIKLVKCKNRDEGK